MRTARTWASLTVATAVSACVCGCQFTGFGSLPLPFTKGTGSGTYTVTAEMSNASTLPPNAEVTVGDITVGTVTAIRYSDWRADLTISLPDRIRLPANATAAIGQKSLLGAEYVELAAPTGAEKPAGRLAGGDVIPLSRTSTYPSAEDVLSTLSSVLNGGGLNQLSTITSELNKALGGHEEQVRELLGNLRTLAVSLNQQRGQIIATISDLNDLAAEVRKQDAMLSQAIDSIPSGLAVLNQDKADLTRALGAVSNLSTVADRVVNESSQNLLANLRDLRPAVTKLADAGHNLVGSLSVLPTFPFTRNTVMHGMKGDYGNLVATFDLTLPKLEKTWLAGETSGKPAAVGGKSSSAADNPLTAPLKNLPSGLKPSPSPSRSSAPGGGSGGLGGILGGLTGGKG
ncbi:MAG: MCE family protein [Streptosporangiales bacterium]|nr:MCE family protein [Streptosporangiales bacterium]